MKQPCLMGIEIGTQSTRAALIGLDGQLLASADTQQEMFTPRPGWAEQDPEVWWNATIQNIQQVFKNGDYLPDQVIAVGVSGQMHGSVPIGSDGGHLADRVQLWCDKRSAHLVHF